MNKPLLSIAIATKNREIFCIEAIQNILDYQDDRFEITVADNSKSTLVKEFVEHVNSPQIKYLYDDSEISSIDNFNRCIDLTNGEYIMMIGDDDSVLLDILEITEWAKKNNIESIASTHPVNFIWPNPNIEEFANGQLTLNEYKGGIQYIDTKTEVLKLVKAGFLAYQSYSLPRLYHGIIKKSCMDKIKTLTGFYFQGLTPDIYSTVALGCLVNSHYSIDYPISIAGACPSSTTVESTTGAHSGKIEDAPHLRNRKDYQWETTVPRYYSVETIWAESAIKALRDVNQEQLLKYFNKYRLYVYGIEINKKYIRKLCIEQTYNMYKVLGVSKFAFKFNMAREYFKISCSVIVKRYLTKKAEKQNSTQYTGVISLKEVVELVEKNNKRMDLQLNKYNFSRK